MNPFRICVRDAAELTLIIAFFISSLAQLLQYGAAGLCCPNKLKCDIGRDTTKIIALIACSW
jgi:hypothetical protein